MDRHRALPGPQGIPVLLPVREQRGTADRRAQAPEQPGPLGAFGGERFERPEDDPAVAQPYLGRQRPYGLRRFG